MLVCSVSLHPRRTISTAIAEVVTARDVATSVNAIFSLGVDEPASVIETVDAFLGEIMLEAANAADVTDVTFIYVAEIDEAAAAMDAPDVTGAPTATARDAMVAGVFVNSDGISRQANASGVMVNL